MTDIVSSNSIAEVDALIGDPDRVNILSALMGGQALTAGELAWHARVSPQTTSGHLAKLADAGLIAAAQRVEHYEIAAYGSLATYAKLLGLMQDKELLGQTLQEEKNTDGRLTVLAESLNLEAAEGELPRDQFTEAELQHMHR